MRTALFLTAALATVALSGCGDVPRGRIYGTIKFQGRPLTDASVVFLAKDNRTYLADLRPDGSYEVSGVALGPVKVSVQQFQPRPAPKSERAPAHKAEFVDEKASAPRPAEPKELGPRIPAHYGDADKSGLTFELTAPDQEWSVDLK
jgi:hypothetical protein